MNRDDLNDRIRDVVRYCTGLTGDTVRPANDTSQADGDVFATVFCGTVAKEGKDEHTWEPDTDSTVLETVAGPRLVTASIQFFRKDAYDLATKLESKITLEGARALMQSHNLGFVGTSNVRDFANVINSSWEGRAQIDAEFYFIAAETGDIAALESFPIVLQTHEYGPPSEPDYQQSSEVFEP